jgi:hypothetical protein
MQIKPRRRCCVRRCSVPSTPYRVAVMTDPCRPGWIPRFRSPWPRRPRVRILALAAIWWAIVALLPALHETSASDPPCCKQRGRCSVADTVRSKSRGRYPKSGQVPRSRNNKSMPGCSQSAEVGAKSAGGPPESMIHSTVIFLCAAGRSSPDARLRGWGISSDPRNLGLSFLEDDFGTSCFGSRKVFQ